MTDFSEIIAQIVAVIKENGKREITGQILQDILVAMLEAVAKNADEGRLIPEGGVTAEKLADGAVITVKIGDNAVTVAKLAQDVVEKFAAAFGTQSPLSFKTIEGVKTLTIDLSDYYNKAQSDAALQALSEAITQAYTKAIADERREREADVEDLSGVAEDLQEQINAEIGNRENALANEKTDRENADKELNERIEALIASSDVKDIVGTYEELEAYDKSTLGDKDIIKVLSDSTHGGTASYYRFIAETQSFNYIGSDADGYTKSEADDRFQSRVEAEREHQSMSQAITDLSQGLGEAQQSISDLSRGLSTAQSNITELQGKQTEQGTTLTEHTTKLNQIEAQIGAIAADLDEINGEEI